jgi:flagellin
MKINHNISSLYANRQLSMIGTRLEKSIERLSSGQRLTSAGQDPAGFAQSQRMRSDIRGLDAAIRNSEDALSLIQQTESSLNETQTMLQRLNELATQAASGTSSNSDRVLIQLEVTQILAEIDRIASTTKFGSVLLLQGGVQSDGSTTESLSFQVTARQTSASAPSLVLSGTSGIDARASGLSIANLTITSRDLANSAVTLVENALDAISTDRATLGALASRLESANRSLTNEVTEKTKAESRIRDLDVASEIVEFTKGQIMTQAATSILAQSNIQPQFVLQLLP